jgi:hypothetical protein
MIPEDHSSENEIQRVVDSNQDIFVKRKKKGTGGYGFDSSPELPDLNKLIDLHPNEQQKEQIKAPP